MKKNKASYACVCANCEYALRKCEDDETVYCKKKKRDVSAIGKCRAFFYDILKHEPARPREIPTLDPSLIDL